MWLLIAFIAVPLIEIALFIEVGGAIGLWPTLLIVVLTAILGSYLVRQQGLSAIHQVRNRVETLQDPTEALIGGVLILFSGALLLTPGFFTDALGFALLVPGIRAAIYRALRNRMDVRTVQHGKPKQENDIIEGEYEEIPPRGDRSPSGWTKDHTRH